MTTHTFDWHDENRQNTFLAWAFVNFAGFTKLGQEQFDELSEATDKFQNVVLGVTVNGIEVDAKGFMDRLDEAMDWAVEREAKRMLLERVPRLEQIEEAIADFEHAVKERMLRLAADAGFEITEDDWRYR